MLVSTEKRIVRKKVDVRIKIKDDSFNAFTSPWFSCCMSNRLNCEFLVINIFFKTFLEESLVYSAVLVSDVRHIICGLFNDSHSDRYEVIPHCGSDLHFSIN